MKKQLLKNLKLRAVMLVALLCAGISGAWGETVTGTITFGNGTIKINSSSVTATDNLNKTWTITTVGTDSYTQHSDCSQVGSKDKPATSITFTTTLDDNAKNITDFSAKFGGYNSTAGDVTLKIDETSVANGSLNGTSEVTISANSNLPTPGKVLTVTVTNIARAVNVYYINYSYDTAEVPTHTATFSINGNTDQTAEVAEGTSINFPTNLGDLYGKTFVGWTTEPIEGETNVTPTTLVQSATMGSADVTYYAVYAIQEVTTGNYMLDYGQETSLQNSKDWGSYGKSYNYTATDGSQWTIKAYKSNGMQINTGKNSSIKVPNCPGTITSIVITNSAAKAVGFSVTDYNGSGTLTYLVYGTDKSTQTLNLSNENVTTGYIVPKGGSTAITKIVVNYRSVTYSAYCTSFPAATFTLSENCYDLNNGTKKYYGTYSNPSAFVVPESLTAHTISVANGVLSVTDYETGTIVPANTGVMVSSATAGEKTVVLTSAASTVSTENNMLRPTGTGIYATDMTETGYKFYYLTMNGNQIGFWWRATNGAAFDMNVANKAYLAVPAGQVGSIKGFSFNDVVDGIKTIETTEIENNAIYNLAGQRVSKMQKGIYIVNGKKFIRR